MGPPFLLRVCRAGTGEAAQSPGGSSISGLGRERRLGAGVALLSPARLVLQAGLAWGQTSALYLPDSASPRVVWPLGLGVGHLT